MTTGEIQIRSGEMGDEEARNYDPAERGYRLADDPRCLWGWGPPACSCGFGHACFRAFGHKGRCWDGGEPPRHGMKCETSQRPKNWDTCGRAEANRMRRVCRCHSADYLYGSLTECPRCHHRSFDPYAESCERRSCGYEASSGVLEDA